jgi:CrcB protein
MFSASAYLAVAVGGAIGSVARFWLTGVMFMLTGMRFPWGTLVINVLGSFAIGLIGGLSLTPERIILHPDLKIFLIAGLCGGFTTFSAFSLQTLELIHGGKVVLAGAYVAASVVLCLAMTWAGWTLGRLG